MCKSMVVDDDGGGQCCADSASLCSITEPVTVDLYILVQWVVPLKAASTFAGHTHW